MNAIRGRISVSGRLSLPVEMRRAVGLERGGDIVIELEGRVIRIRAVDEIVAEAQALTRRLLEGKRDISVDAFLAARQRTG